MKKWVQKTAGLVMSVFLALGLGPKVHAADEEESLPAPAPVEEVQPAPAPAAEAPAPVPETEAPKPAAPAPSVEAPKPAESKPAESKPAETKPVETKPAESTPAESKPAESKPAESKPAESKPAESKPAESKPAESKPVETKPAESKPSESKPAETAPAEIKPAESKPADTAPVEQSKPVQTAPAAESTPPESKPAETAPVEPEKPAEAAPVKEVKPSGEPSSVDKPDAGEGTVSVKKPVPVQETAPAEAQDPIAEEAAAEEPAPVQEPVSAENADPVEEPDSAEGPVRVGDPVPAGVVPAVENEPEGTPLSEEGEKRVSALLEAGQTGEDAADESAFAETADDTTVTAPVAAAVPAPEIITVQTMASTGSFRSASASVSTAAQTDPSVSLGGQNVDLSKDTPLNGGWGYDAGSGRLIMVNYDGSSSSLLSDGTGVTILASGFNRVGTLSCDGNIEIIGTGILLVDTIELPEGNTLNISANRSIYTDADGSVAVFLRNSDGVYELLNGTVPGLLDERYDLPDDVTLSIPENTSLSIRSVYTKTETDSDGNETVTYTTQRSANTGSVSYAISSAALNVSKILSQGVIRLDAPEPFVSLKVRGSGSSIRDIITSGCSFLELGSDTSVDTLTTAGNARVVLGDGVSIGELIVSGSTRVSVGDDNTIGDINVAASGDVEIANREAPSNGNALTVTGTVSGGKLSASGGPLVFGRGASFGEDGGVTSETKTGANTYRSNNPVLISNSDSISLAESDLPLTLNKTGHPSLRENVMETLQNDSSPGHEFFIPVTYENDTAYVCGYDIYYLYEYYYTNMMGSPTLDSSSPYRVEVNWEYDDTDRTYSLPDEISLSYGDLEKDYWQDYPEFGEPDIFFQVIVKDSNGDLSVVTLGKDMPPYSVNALDVCMIRALQIFDFKDGTAGSNVTNTSTSSTGTGILGGGAGSVTPGTGRTLFTGTGIHRDTKPVEPDPVDPDPVVPDPVVPDPVVPDPVVPDPIVPDPVVPDPVDPDPDPDPTEPPAVTFRNDLRVIVTFQKTNNTLRVYNGTKEITDLGGQKVTARVKFSLPAGWNKNAIFAVFRNADGTLTAFKAMYDAKTGELTFDTDLTGTFTLVSFPFDGDPLSEKFYEALAELDEIRALPVRR